MLYSPTIREEFFSETQSPLPCILEYSENLRAWKEGQGIDGNASLALPIPQGVMSPINMQTSVPGSTKCPRVQTLLVIAVTIT
jgi:hypothetical protein